MVGEPNKEHCHLVFPLEGISIEYHYEQTIEDLVQQAMQAVEEHRSVRRSAQLTYGLCAFFFGFILFATFTQYGVSLPAFLCGAASCGAFLLAFPTILRRILRRRAKNFTKDKSQPLLERRSFSLTKKGLRMWGSTFDRIYPYTAMQKLTERKGYIVLSLQEGDAVLLPLRAFADDAQHREFLEQLRNAMG